MTKTVIWCGTIVVCMMIASISWLASLDKSLTEVLAFFGTLMSTTAAAFGIYSGVQSRTAVKNTNGRFRELTQAYENLAGRDGEDA